MSQARVTIVEADLARADHQAATLRMVDGYSLDAMADGKPLSDYARENLIAGLRQHPTTMVFLAYLDAEPVGVAVCFRGFSTFQVRPLLNIHDIFVAPAQRRTGIAHQLLATIEQRARDLGYCKLTLEVLEVNTRAQAVYTAAGFVPPDYDGKGGATYFLSKSL